MRSLVLVVVLYNCRGSVTWVSDKGGKVRGVAIVPFRKDRHHHTPLDYTANIFWKHLGWDDMANGSELPINVVRTNTPKGLQGLAQKGWGQGETLPHRLPQMPRHRRTGRASLIHGPRAERGKPVSLPPGKVSRKARRWGGGYGTREEAKA